MTTCYILKFCDIKKVLFTGFVEYLLIFMILFYTEGNNCCHCLVIGFVNLYLYNQCISPFKL